MDGRVGFKMKQKLPYLREEVWGLKGSLSYPFSFVAKKMSTSLNRVQETIQSYLAVP